MKSYEIHLDFIIPATGFHAPAQGHPVSRGSSGQSARTTNHTVCCLVFGILSKQLKGKKGNILVGLVGSETTHENSRFPIPILKNQSP